MSKPRSWIIGAGRECDIVVNEPTVSGQHCRLVYSAGRYQLHDLDSTNGTYVNGRRLDGPAAVSPDDRITLGQDVPFPWYAVPTFRPAAEQRRTIVGSVEKPSSSPPENASRSPFETTAREEKKTAGSPTAVPDRQSKKDDKQPPAQRPPLPPGKQTPAVPPAPVARKIIRIGREVDNDIVIDTPVVSRHHARLTVDGTSITLEDLNSSNGTAVRSPQNRITSAAVDAETAVFFGTYKTTVAKLLSEADPQSRRVATIGFRHNSIVLGRDEQCDQVLNYPMISRRHARLTRTGDEFFVEDLGSSNGTFVNGKRISLPTRVRPGDHITLGSCTFQLTPRGQLEQHNFQNSFTIEARGISIDVPKRRLLEKISLTILPGEFVGLMGPSGAGKSTLMGALNGYTPPSEGNVFINGHDLYREFDQFRGQIGFVPQDDIVHRDLTVEQALYYSARLRLPSDYSNEDIRNRITKVLKELGLEAARKSRIGLPDRSVLSGGQRKRVNLAMELITDPSILFLDEPTSGLSSEDTLEVMKLLRQLADQGKTILLTIHQPSQEVYRLMDHLVIVAKDAGSAEPGRLAWFGPAFPDSILFFNPQLADSKTPTASLSPDEVLRGLGRDTTEKWVKRYAGSQYKRDYVDARQGRHKPQPTPVGFNRKRRENGLLQWFTLSRRCLAIKLKDVLNTTILMAQAPIIAILVVMVFSKHSGKVMDLENFRDVTKATTISVFLMTLSALWFGCSNAVREIVAEWTVYKRERMVNLKIWPYVASKFTVLGGLCFIQCLVLMLIVYFGGGLRGNWFGMFILLLLASGVGLSIGLLVSALVKTSEVAVALLPLILLPMVILGGVLQPIHEMNGLGKFCASFMPSRWAFEGLLLLESKKREMPEAPEPPRRSRRSRYDRRYRSAPPDVPAAPKIEIPPDMADPYFPKKKERLGIGVSFLVLLLMFGGLVGAIFGVLRLRDVH